MLIWLSFTHCLSHSHTHRSRQAAAVRACTSHPGSIIRLSKSSPSSALVPARIYFPLHLVPCLPFPFFPDPQQQVHPSLGSFFASVPAHRFISAQVSSFGIDSIADASGRHAPLFGRVEQLARRGIGMAQAEWVLPSSSSSPPPLYPPCPSILRTRPPGYLSYNPSYHSTSHARTYQISPAKGGMTTCAGTTLSIAPGGPI